MIAPIINESVALLPELAAKVGLKSGYIIGGNEMVKAGRAITHEIVWFILVRLWEWS